ncbi:MAG: tetratricopeptide repeat protein [Deltaproteobacteria bacterium]|nr:tetratricopeptide repeat protein [Deltaproteobacteria bacterium]
MTALKQSPFLELRPFASLLTVLVLFGSSFSLSAEITLEAVPSPDLTVLEASVAAQIQATQKTLSEAISASLENPQQLAGLYGDLGMLYHAYDLPESAAVSYRNAASISPRDFRWLYYLGLLSQQQGQLEMAEQAFQHALGSRPQNLATRVHLSEVLIALDRPEQAMQHLHEALLAHPKDASAHAAMGQIALSQGRHEDAVQHLTQALETTPQANRLHYPLGLAYRGLGKMEEAKHHLALRGPVGVRPADSLADALPELLRGERVHLLRGRAAFRAGRFEEAAAAFQAAAEADPASGRALTNLGTALARAGQPDAAMERFRQAIAVEPTSASAYYNLGEMLASQGKPVAARQHLEKAIDLDSKDFQAHLALAQLLRNEGELDLARSHFTSALGINPHSEAARFGEAATLVDLQLYAEALQRLEEAHTLLPDQGRIIHALARLLAGSPDASLRNGDRALVLALKAFEARKSIPHAETVAMAYAELGRCDEAAQWQGNTVEAAENAGLDELSLRLREKLKNYQDKETCQSRPLTEGGT